MTRTSATAGAVGVGASDAEAVTKAPNTPAEPEPPNTPDPAINALRVQFGENVRRTRIEKGLRQLDIAAALGSSQAYVSTIEKGRQNTTMEMAALIAKALGVDVSDLLITTDTDFTLDQVELVLSRLQAEVQHEKRRGGKRLTGVTIRRVLAAILGDRHN